jgi:hypothetical protein
MTELPKEANGFERPAKEQAALIVELLRKTMSEADPDDTEDCLELDTLAAFTTGRLDRMQSIRVLSHLTACVRCRLQKRLLDMHAGPEPVYSFDLARLREAVKLGRAWVVPAVKEVRAFFRECLLPLPGERARVLYGRRVVVPALAAAQEAASGKYIGLEVVSPPVLDRNGRLSIELLAAVPLSDSTLEIALRNSVHQVELCVVPVAGGRAHAIIDCSFLELPEGLLPPDILRLGLAPAGQRHGWKNAGILPALQRLSDAHLEPADFFDNATMVLAARGEQWQQSLRAEVAALADPSAGTAQIQSVMNRLTEYIAIWKGSNQAGPADGEAFVSELQEILHSTRPPARGRGEMKSRTIRPARSRKEPGVATAGVETEEEK